MRLRSQIMTSLDLQTWDSTSELWLGAPLNGKITIDSKRDASLEPASQIAQVITIWWYMYVFLGLTEIAAILILRS